MGGPAHGLPVAERWFTSETVAPGIICITEPYCDDLVRANCHLVLGRDANLLVDTGMGVSSMRAAVPELASKPLIIVTTHTHIDHAAGHAEFTSSGLRVEVLVHKMEADMLLHPFPAKGLGFDQFGEQKEVLRAAGFAVDKLLVDAVPSADYDPDSYEYKGVAATRTVDEGDVVDLGDRQFTVLHLPGHSPGSIGLWEAETGILFSGDAIYDGQLIDDIDNCSVPDYLRTMARLRELPVERVFGGHCQSFGRTRMMEIIDAYVASRRPN
ncbi:beta-lactamase-like protein [Hyaloraphidium curvatum]|nr:beta-lactamase-like protein [Hyaloraphidium curvatum]